MAKKEEIKVQDFEKIEAPKVELKANRGEVVVYHILDGEEINPFITDLQTAEKLFADETKFSFKKK